MMVWFYCYILELLFIHAVHVTASGKIMVEFLSYENPSKKRADGNCCTASSLTSTCRYECYDQFKICLSDTTSKCNVIEYTSKIFEHDYISFPKNYIDETLASPIIKSFHQWKGNLSMEIEVTDRHPNNQGLVASFKKNEYLSAHSNGEEKIGTVDLETGKLRSMKTLTLNISVTCDVGYIPPDCVKYCFPSDDDVNGHYICSETADKICMKGWVNETSNCTIKECYPLDNEYGHFSCSPMGEKSCFKGWVDEAKNCTIKECYPIDNENGHFKCSPLGDIVCLSGWVNETTNCTIKFCQPRDDNKGHYGCLANGEKVCLDGWGDTAQNCLKSTINFVGGEEDSLKEKLKFILPIIFAIILLIFIVAVLVCVKNKRRRSYRNFEDETDSSKPTTITNNNNKFNRNNASILWKKEMFSERKQYGILDNTI